MGTVSGPRRATPRWGITLPLPGLALRDHRAVIERLVGLGYSDVWTGEGSGDDAFTPLAMSAAWAPSLRLGTGVVPVYTRGPAVLAQTAASLAELATGEVLLGIGASVPAHVTDYNGIAYAEPYRRVRDTARFLRRALAGERVEGQFETFAIGGFQLARPPERPPKVIVGALRPGMLKLAYAEADGAMTNLLLAEDVPRIVEAIGPANLAAGKELIVKVFLCPTTDAAYARRQARRFLAWILNREAYRAFQSWLGRGEQLAAMHARWETGDRAGAEAAIPDEIVDGLYLHGSPESCRAQLARFVHPGVTTMLLYVAPTPELAAHPGLLPELLGALVPGGAVPGGTGQARGA